MAERRWTAEQAAAIRRTGPTLLEANAGTGKTTTVVGAILWRLGLEVGDAADGTALGPCPAEHRITLERLAAITFTEKAAYDLKQKLREAIGAAAPALLWELDRAAIGTIHSFCADALKEHALRFRLDPAFTILDERDAGLEQEWLARELILDRLGAHDAGVTDLVEKYPLTRWGEYGASCLDPVLAAFRSLRWHGRRWEAWRGADGSLDRARLAAAAAGWTDADDAPLALCDTLAALARELAARWEAWLREENARDFDALILDLRDRLLDPAMAPALAGLRRRFGFFVIDEFQDTDEAQWEIAAAIAALGATPGTGPQLLLVGDPKQSIYRFRGADVAMWNVAAQRIPEAGRLRLTRNFRSTPAIVAFANRVAEPALREAARVVTACGLPSAVAYSPLQPARPAAADEGVTWLESHGKAGERRTLEATLAAAEIRRIARDDARGDRESLTVVDPDTREVRPCRYRDVAILFRNRLIVAEVITALEAYGVPYYLAGDAGLKDRLEVLDVLALLRLLENPLDDLHAFAFLRSPFVGLRDETIAALRLAQDRRPLLEAARAWLARPAWFAAPEHPAIVEVERASLEHALTVLRQLARMPARAPLHRLVEEAVERLGYRLHLLLRPQPESRLANLARFIGLLEEHRAQTVGTFLELWDRRDREAEQGIPQAPLYSRRDDVVTLSTVHSAKGLEWPVVFLLDSDAGFRDTLGNALVVDRELGPVVFPKQEERGGRTRTMAEREMAEDVAEEARLMYVAVTRARDRLYVAGPRRKPRGVAQWLLAGVTDDVAVVARPAAVEVPAPPPAPALAWLDLVEAGAAPSDLVGGVPGTVRAARSASELMARLRDGPEWRERYVHGVLPARIFGGSAGAGGDAADAVPGWIRGQLIHGVLERIRDAEELSLLLDVAIGALDAPELEERLAVGSRSRLALEDELRRVVSSAEWAWYVEGAHWRELPFVHLRRRRRWRVGAFDLFRAGAPEGTPDLIVDFKTHPIDAASVPDAAARYAAQVAIYRAAARAAGRTVAVRLHFTVPGVALTATEP